MTSKKASTSSLFSRLIAILLSLSAAGALFSLGALFSDNHMALDLVSHFRIKYITLIPPAIFIALCTRKYYLTALLCICIARIQ